MLFAHYLCYFFFKKILEKLELRHKSAGEASQHVEKQLYLIDMMSTTYRWIFISK